MKNLLAVVWAFWAVGLASRAVAQTVYCQSVGNPNTDEFFSAFSNSHGEFLMVGYSYKNPGTAADVYVVKTDSLGQVVWSAIVGGTSQEYGYHGIVTRDGGVLAVGSTESIANDMYIVKLDSTGGLEWTRTVVGSSIDEARAAVQTWDGGYCIVGSTGSFAPLGGLDVYAVKLDSAGNLLWTTSVGGAGADMGYAVQENSRRQLEIVGMTNSYGAGNNDMYWVRLDSAGALLGTKTYGGTNLDEARAMVFTADGGRVLAGKTRSFGQGYEDVLLLKVDSLGNPVWVRTLGLDTLDDASSLAQLPNGDLVLLGTALETTTGKLNQMLGARLDASGNLIWAKTFGGIGPEQGYGVIYSNNMLMLVGSSGTQTAGAYDGYMVRTNLLGESCCGATYPAILDTVGTLQVGTGGSVSTGGSLDSVGTATTGAIVTSNCVLASRPDQHEGLKALRVKPNPGYGSFWVALPAMSAELPLLLADAMGREVARYRVLPGQQEMRLDLSGLPQGVYLLSAPGSPLQPVRLVKH